MASETTRRAAAARLGSLDYVMLRAADVAALVATYREVLDAAPIEEAYPHWARVRLANIDVGIHHDERFDGRQDEVPGAEPAFRVHDVTALRAALEEAGFSADEYDAIPGGVRLGFRDPAGNALSAIEWGARLEDLQTTPGTAGA
jgi:catechol 2,3-dioxygenase-like lactoylglutathione lyase family enzyme